MKSIAVGVVSTLVATFVDNSQNPPVGYPLNAPATVTVDNPANVTFTVTKDGTADGIVTVDVTGVAVGPFTFTIVDAGEIGDGSDTVTLTAPGAVINREDNSGSVTWQDKPAS